MSAEIQSCRSKIDGSLPEIADLMGDSFRSTSVDDQTMAMVKMFSNNAFRLEMSIIVFEGSK